MEGRRMIPTTTIAGGALAAGAATATGSSTLTVAIVSAATGIVIALVGLAGQLITRWSQAKSTAKEDAVAAYLLHELAERDAELRRIRDGQEEHPGDQS